MGLAVYIVLTCIEHNWFFKVVHVDKNKKPVKTIKKNTKKKTYSNDKYIWIL